MQRRSARAGAFLDDPPERGTAGTSAALLNSAQHASAAGRTPLCKIRLPRQANAGLLNAMRPIRTAKLKPIATVVCAFALAANGLWPMAPMPKAWERTALPVGLRLAFCGSSFPLTPRTPKSPTREDPRSNPLTCPLCQLAHGTTTASATPPVVLPEPIANPWRDVLPAITAGASQRRASRLGARAPPLALHV
jgi:hypothetical protein